MGAEVGAAAVIGAKGPHLVVRLEVSAAMAKQAQALFILDERDQQSGKRPITPLARRKAGFIGGPETLKGLYGNAVVMPAAVGSGQPSLLFVACFGENCVRVFDANSGENICSIATGHKPRGLALRSMGPPGSGRPAILYVAEEGDHRVQAFNADTGAHLRFLGTGVAGSAIDQFNGPTFVALHEPPAGSVQPTLLFVADGNNHRVQVLDADTGAHLRTIGAGTYGKGKGQVGTPRGLAYQPAGPSGSGRPAVLYVAEFYNHRVQAFDADTGAHLRFFGTGDHGSGMDQFYNPTGVALREPPLESGGPTLLYVADSDNNRVQVFDADTGAVVRTIGSIGSALGQLKSPRGVTVHHGADGVTLLFVTEYDNKRVQVFVL